MSRDRSASEASTVPLRADSTTNSPNEKRTRPKCTRTASSFCWNVKIWRAELIALLFCLAALGATVGTLLPHHDKPLPSWPFYISINTLISIYAFVLKAGLSFLLQQCIGQLQWFWFSSERALYDIVRYQDAGQGPWGSLTWLRAHHFRNPAMTFGVVIVLCSTAIDPFFQQLLQSYNCQVPMDGVTALAPRTNYVTCEADLDGFETVFDGSHSAMLTGALGAPEVVTIECPTGNCTFPTEGYSSVGYCSQCMDISDRIEFDVISCWGGSGLQEVPCDGTGGQILGRNVTSSVTSPYSDGAVFPFTVQTVSMVGPGPASEALVVADSENDHGEVYEWLVLAGKTVFSDNGIDPWTGRALHGCSDTSQNNTSWRCRGYGAASCLLYPCTQSHEANVTVGKMSEEVTAQSSFDIVQSLDLPTQGAGDYQLITLLDLDCLTFSEKSQLAQQGYDTSNGRWIRVNQTVFGNTTNPLQTPLLATFMDRQCAYVFDKANGSNTLTSCYFSNGILDGTLSYELGVNVTYPSNYTLTWFFETTQLAPGQDTLERLYSMGNISFESVQDTFQNMSLSISSYIRQNAQSYNTPAKGAALHYAVCEGVQWPWLAFPAALVLAAALLLLGTSIVTMQSEVPMWKTSPLALLFHGPQLAPTSPPQIYEEAQQALLNSTSLEDMENEAKRRNVQLHRTAKGVFYLAWAYETS